MECTLLQEEKHLFVFCNGEIKRLPICYVYKEKKMDVFDCIITRRSVRSYGKKRISQDCIRDILYSAIYTPSGKNGQPWKFQIVSDNAVIKNLAERSIYNKWMADAEYVRVVFLDTTKSYNWMKDVQSCGAAIQNMLLTACSLEVGSCWIGEVVDYAQDVKSILGVSSKDLELMGMVTLGSTERGSITRDKAMCTKCVEDFLI